VKSKLLRILRKNLDVVREKETLVKLTDLKLELYIKKDPSTKTMLADKMDCLNGVSTKVDCLVTQVKEVEDSLGAVNQSLVNLKTD
jgi:hypothetical protein